MPATAPESAPVPTPAPQLPVFRERANIVRRVDEAKITIIMGETGCGKSTGVPRILYDHFGGKVLCTQPRRLAVVAVATRVAEELGEALGGDSVGYHIGQVHKAHERTRLLFSTVGIFLEQIKSNGAQALNKYSVLIIDEVHERSSESDLVLAAVRQLLPECPHLKIVIMSATVEYNRYKLFFESRLADPLDFKVVGLAQDQRIFNLHERYLEHALELLADTPTAAQAGGWDAFVPPPLTERSTGVLRQQSEAAGAMHGMDDCLLLITRLVLRLLRLQDEEGSQYKTVLVFLPTWRQLEEAHKQLTSSLHHSVPLHLLHSSVDMEECMSALSGRGQARPCVVLASAVAESSVTIEGVAHVVDCCRANEVLWNHILNRQQSRLVWTSKAQATQRAGRAGRTSDGTVWRLVPRRLYDGFNQYETPAVSLLPLRREALLVACAVSPLLSHDLLAQCLDAPPPDNVQSAQRALLQMRALEQVVAPAPSRSRRNRQRQPAAAEPQITLRPTALGTLMDALPVSLESASFLLHAALAQMLPEALTLAAIDATCPTPLRKQPNQPRDFEELLAKYGPMGATEDRAEDVLLANYAAYCEWRHMLVDVQQWRRGQREMEAVAARRRGEAPGANAEAEAEADALEEGLWCSGRNMSRTALHAVATTRALLLEALFRLSPPLLKQALPLRPSALDPHAAPAPLAPGSRQERLLPKFLTPHTEKKLKKLLDLLQPEQAEAPPVLELTAAAGPFGEANRAQMCAFFLRGACTKGAACPFAHAATAQRPLCRHYYSLEGCRFGRRCMYRHPDDAPENLPTNDVECEVATAEIQAQVQNGLAVMESKCVSVREQGVVDAGHGANALPPLDYLQYARVFLLGEGDFSFSHWLASRAAHAPPATTQLRPEGVIASSYQRRDEVERAHPERGAALLDELSRWGATVLHGVDARRLHAAEAAGVDDALALAPGALLWNFPFAGDDLLASDHEEMLRRFFFSAMLCAVGHPTMLMCEVHLTLRPFDVSRWAVLPAAEASHFWLRSVHAFDPGSSRTARGQGATAPHYTPRCNDTDSGFDISDAITYVFAFDGTRVQQAAAMASRQTLSVTELQALRQVSASVLA